MVSSRKPAGRAVVMHFEHGLGDASSMHDMGSEQVSTHTVDDDMFRLEETSNFSQPSAERALTVVTKVRRTVRALLFAGNDPKQDALDFFGKGLVALKIFTYLHVISMVAMRI